MAGDVQFDGQGCANAPVTINYTKSGAEIDDISGQVMLETRYIGSSDSNNATTYIGYSKPGQGSEASEFSICSFEIEDGMTTMEVTGSIESGVFTGSRASSPLTPSTLNIIQNPTKLSKPGSKKWTEVTTPSADSFEKWSFSYVSYRDVPRNSTIRVSVTGCGWCSAAQVTVKGR